MAAKRWFITGASSGFGRVLTEEALARGDRVAATARNPETLAELVARAPDRICALRLDVTRADEIRQAIDGAVAAFGGLDVLVNNAGFAVMGAIEEVSDADTRLMFETHLFGAMAIIRAALPHLRQQRSGLIINMSSIGGLVGYPGGGIYSACKFALEGMSEALAGELRPLGIRVLLVEPGSFRTDFFTRSLKFSDPIADYGQTLRSSRNADLSGLPDPAIVARAIADAAERPDQPLRLMIGADAVEVATGKLRLLSEAIEAAQR